MNKGECYERQCHREMVFCRRTVAENARQMLEDFLSGRIFLVVPMFCFWEVANAFWVGVRRGRLTPKEASDNWQSFVTLGLHLGGEFWTADERLVHAVRGQLSFVRWLGDYPMQGAL